MKIFVTGVSGTGKTSIANVLKEKGVTAFSIDEVAGLCKWIRKDNGKVVDYQAELNNEFINSHVWICDKEKLKRLISEYEDIVILGIVENQEELLPFFDKILLLQCSPETFLKRIEQREDNIFGKDKTAQEYILETYNSFENNMLRRGAISINVEQPLKKVVEMILLQF